MAALLDLTGQVYGRLTVTGPRIVRGRKAYWVCRCKCGTVCERLISTMRRGEARSCGCLNAELSAARRPTHGHTIGGHSPEYAVWSSMLARCENPKNSRYGTYGARGITVCEAWHKFESFIADMGLRPSPKHQIDRVNNDLGYFAENCRWTTHQVNVNNRTTSRRITFGGETLTVSEWNTRLGFSRGLIDQRLDKLGWSVEQALTTPVKVLRPRRRAA